MANVYDFTVKDRKGNEVNLSEYKGKVLLIVNTATGCGFTPHYDPLEAMYRELRDKGFEILDFPCNQFANQAPESDDQIHEFCTLRYKTQFDQMKKIDVNGENEDPLYTFLKKEMPEEEVKGLKAKAAMKAVSKISKSTKAPEDIKWNFTKFLVDREGKVVGRYNPTVEPEKIEGDIAALI